MSIWTVIPAFAAMILLGAMSPGPDFAIVVRRAALSGRFSGMTAALGVVVGVSVWVIAAATGVAAILTASATLYMIVKIAGAVYLLILGARALYAAIKHKGEPVVDGGEAREVSTWQAFRQGLLCNVLNPKAGVFFVALIPQFLPSHSNLLDAVQLAAVAVIVTLAWYVLVANVVGVLRGLFRRPAVRRALDAATGAVLVALGIRVATSTN